jgi:hypothetical protein
MIKWINKLVSKNTIANNHARHMSDEERFIIAQNPQDVRDIEYWSREYDRRTRNRSAFNIIRSV